MSSLLDIDAYPSPVQAFAGPRSRRVYLRRIFLRSAQTHSRAEKMPTPRCAIYLAANGTAATRSLLSVERGMDVYGFGRHRQACSRSEQTREQQKPRHPTATEQIRCGMPSTVNVELRTDRLGAMPNDVKSVHSGRRIRPQINCRARAFWLWLVVGRSGFDPRGFLGSLELMALPDYECELWHFNGSDGMYMCADLVTQCRQSCD